MRSVFVIAALSLMTSACVTGGASNGGSGVYASVADACRDRGGVLTPSIDQRLTGKAGSGYVCRISGGASRIPPPATTAG